MSTLTAQESREELQARVHAIINDTAVTDLHTHLYAPPFKSLLLYGIDELLTYHYLIAEVLRATRVPYESYWNMSKREQADFIWKQLFLERSPISEACRGVLTVLHQLGLDVASRDLNEYRVFFDDQAVENHVAEVLLTANVRDVVMTNDPFDDLERPVWEAGYNADPRFHAALRIDPLLNDFANASARLRAWGYAAGPDTDASSLSEVRRFLLNHAKRMNALYMAVSLPPDFAFPEDRPRAKIIAECVVPVARELNIPFAMMIGVKRAVNPALKLAGDGVARADVGAVERICATFPRDKFMVTMLSRENQHDLCVAGRKFPNLFIFGCWWFLNNPSLIEEMTRMRLEMLGLSVTPQHSDARVLEQVIYKWDHSRAIIGKVLGEKFADLAHAGWQVSDEEIRRDATRILGGGFWEFQRATL
ncbi:MAG TPA: glucuronate isomerase [Candidatus Hydrogenedentes bacterium]|nr:glucuronate isomerase [Candidatus Hydrogenedentota bacterium]HRK34401.1 glucuronate isomerase [Candidatus Hydrogenedentota bacterium]